MTPLARLSTSWASITSTKASFEIALVSHVPIPHTRIMAQDSVYAHIAAAEFNEEEGLVTSTRKGHALPSYDKGHITGWLALSGLTLVWICGLVCIAIASSLFARQRPYTAVGQTALLPAGSVIIGNQGELYAFLVTAIVTMCTEGTGFVHDICLRWDLFREGRLRWTTNLRLLSTSRVTHATRTPSNLLYFSTLALAYTASSQIFVPTAFSASDMGNLEGYELLLGTSASGAALMILGICFFLQAAIVTWIYLASRRHIKTWSSNTLTILLACMSSDSAMASASDNPKYSSVVSTATRVSHDHILEHQLGPPPCSQPYNRQASLFATRKIAIRRTLCVISALPVLVLIWAAIVLNAWKRSEAPSSFDSFASGPTKLNQTLQHMMSTDSDTFPAIQPFSVQNDPGSGSSLINAGTTIFVCLIIVFCLQVYLTFALHCAEVLINSARDQRFWEKAARRMDSKERGAPLNMNVVVSFFANPSNVILLLAKVVAHWLFNQSLLPIVLFSNSYDIANWQCILTQICYYGVPTLVLAAVALVLTGIAWYEACRSPKGPQPSTYGHLQTLMELVDEWGSGERLYWGDKGVTSDGLLRRAGTSGNADAVGPVHFDAEYI